jgi:glucose-1-phosphate cytidylyltransferase
MVKTVAILCGGRGTRLAGELPKPLVEVGGHPIVWHVASIFAAQGVRRVVLLTGYRAALVAEWAAGAAWPAGVEVTCVDTGEDTPTGGRVLAAGDAIGPGRFFLTYGDGVALLDGSDRVTGFREKPVADEWVNGGFLVLEPEVLGYLEPGSVLAREPLERLAVEGRLQAFRHDGFWACMDTHKDALALNALWHSGRAPWVAK